MAWRSWSDRFKSPDSSVASFSKKLCDEDANTLWSQGTQDSWIELGPPSRGSIASSAVDAALLMEAQASAKGSPKSLASPFAKEAPPPDLQLLNAKLMHHSWHSRVEAVPTRPLEVLVPAELASQLTTPPNSPAPKEDSGFGFRHSRLARSELFRVEVVLGLVLSNLATFLLGAAIGFYISKHRAQGSH